MPNSKNGEMLAKVKESLDNSKGVFFIDYRGLTVKETQELRRKLTAAGAHMKVYKNNIVKIALEQAEMPVADVAGTVAYVFYENDPVAAAKVIKEESKALKKIEWLGAIADGQSLSADEAKAYAELPSRDELMAQLVYVIASPLSGIAQVCAGPARGLATVLDAIADQKNAA